MNVGANLRKRADGRYEARYEKGRTENGAIIYGYCYGRTNNEAEWKRQDAILLNKNIDCPDMTFSDLIALFRSEKPENEALCDLFEAQRLDPILDSKLNRLSARLIHTTFVNYKRTHLNELVVKVYSALDTILAYAKDQALLVESPTENSDLLDTFMHRIKAREKRSSNDIGGNFLSDDCYENLLSLLKKKPNERKFGLLISLEMGLTFAEVAALVVSDFDFENRLLTVNKKCGAKKTIVSCPKRVLPVPMSVVDYFNVVHVLYQSPDMSIVRKGKFPPSSKMLTGELSRLNNSENAGTGYDDETLRNTFAMRKLQSGTNFMDLTAYMGESIETMAARYSDYVVTDIGSVIVDEIEEPITVKDGKFNLLILGAGDYGHTVKEIAERIGMFDNISFLDDNTEKTETIGVCTDYESFKGKFNAAFPAFGDNKLRKEYIEKLQEAGYIIPKLIHPDATISPSCTVENGVIIEAKATVNAGATVRTGSLVCFSSLVDKGSTVENYCHIDSTATVTKDSIVAPFTHVECGTVYRR